MTDVASRELVQSFNPMAFADDGMAFASFASVINGLWETCGGAGQLAVVLPYQFAVIRRVSTALGLDQDLLKQQLMWEAGQGMVAPIQDFMVDYQRLPAVSHTGNPIYLLVLLRKTMIGRLQLLAQGLKTRLSDLDLDAFSIIRSLSVSTGLNEDQQVGLINVSGSKLSIILLQHGDFSVIQHIQLPKRESGVKQTPLGAEIAPLLQKELKRMIFGHRLGTSINVLDALYFAGEEVAPDLLGVMRSDCRIPVSSLDPYAKIKVNKSILTNMNPDLAAPYFSAAIGMAHKQRAISIP